MENKIDFPSKEKQTYQVQTDVGVQTEVLATTETEALTQAMMKHHLDEHFDVSKEQPRHSNSAKVTHKFKSKWYSLIRKD